MKTRTFSARLLADAVISERAATTGGHRSLDYIPGATLLGSAAAALYNNLGDDAYTVFHSGKVRFGNAYPLTENGEPSLPIPLAWHVQKGEDLAGSVATVKALTHAAKGDFAAWEKEGIQQKQLRGGYFTPSGIKIDPAKTYRLKTAVSREKQGMAEDVQLFGYQSLAAGSSWHFTVTFDADVPQQVVDRVTSALTGRIRVGRSRSAEYGLLATQLTDTPSTADTPSACSHIVLYCLSDLALADCVTGTPVLTPAGSHFGISGVVLDPQKSFLRVRCYAPFNAKRLRFDLERQVIAKGSVLVFDRQGGFTAEDLAGLQNRLTKGIGLYRQDGLGQVLVNPPFLRTAEFVAAAAPELPVVAIDAETTLPPLAGWLEAKALAQEEEIAAITQVDGWINDLVAGSCPKNSQWGQLRTIALQEGTLEEMRSRIRKLCTEGVSQKQWGKPVKIEGKKTDYGKFLLESVLESAASIEVARKRLYLLGNRLPRKNNQRNGGDQ